MFVSRGALNDILRKNVCEVKFLRKRYKKDKPLYRRILCTLAIENFLNTPRGIDVLHFRLPPKLPIIRPGMTYNPAEYNNLLVVWDIFYQDWRVINVRNANLIWSIPANNEFWNYFDEVISKMSAEQKLQFMDK